MYKGEAHCHCVDVGVPEVVDNGFYRERGHAIEPARKLGGGH